MDINYISSLAVVVTAISTFGIAVLALIVYIKQRPRIKVNITDYDGNKDLVFYFIRTKKRTEKGKRVVFFLICLKISYIQYATTSIVCNMIFELVNIPKSERVGRITRLTPKDPFGPPKDEKKLYLFIDESNKRNLFRNSMYEFELKGCGIFNLVAQSNIDDDVFDQDNPFPEGGLFSFTIGNRSFGPYRLKSYNLENKK